VSCSRPLDQAWTICPYCEADVPGLEPSRPRRRRRTAVVDTELSEITETAGAPAAQSTAGDATAPAKPVASDEVEPAATGDPATRPRAAGRSHRPSSRARPSS